MVAFFEVCLGSLSCWKILSSSATSNDQLHQTLQVYSYTCTVGCQISAVSGFNGIYHKLTQTFNLGNMGYSRVESHWLWLQVGAVSLPCHCLCMHVNYSTRDTAGSWGSVPGQFRRINLRTTYKVPICYDFHFSFTSILQEQYTTLPWGKFLFFLFLLFLFLHFYCTTCALHMFPVFLLFLLTTWTTHILHAFSSCSIPLFIYSGSKNCPNVCLLYKDTCITQCWHNIKIWLNHT